MRLIWPHLVQHTPPHICHEPHDGTIRTRHEVEGDMLSHRSHDISTMSHISFTGVFRLARVLPSSTLLQYTPFSGKNMDTRMLYLAHDDFFSSFSSWGTWAAERRRSGELNDVFFFFAFSSVVSAICSWTTHLVQNDVSRRPRSYI